MANFLIKNTKTIIRLIPVFFLALVFISCQKEDQFTPVIFEAQVPEFSYVDIPVNLTCSGVQLSDVRWEISDGSSYSGQNISHTFKNPGEYTVYIRVYEGNIETSRVTKIIHVAYNHKLYSSSQKFYAVRSFHTDDNTIILEGYIQKSDSINQTAFLILDEKLSVIDTLYDYADVINKLKNVVQIGNNVYALGEMGLEQNSGYTFKTIPPQDSDIPGNKPITQVFNYCSGLIHYYSGSESNMYIDYYTDGLEKLWSRKISTENRTANTYLFNINDVLYFISLDKESDKLYVERFKNVSVSLQKEEYNLGISASDRKILFVFNMPYNNSIALGIYSRSQNITYFISIDEYCNLRSTNSIEGEFKDIPLISLENNSYVTKNGYELRSYNRIWEIQSKNILGTNDFGLCKIGSNLFMLFENLPEGLKLSYIDSHLNTVTFE